LNKGPELDNKLVRIHDWYYRSYQARDPIGLVLERLLTEKLQESDGIHYTKLTAKMLLIGIIQVARGGACCTSLAKSSDRCLHRSTPADFSGRKRNQK